MSTLAASDIPLTTGCCYVFHGAIFASWKYSRVLIKVVKARLDLLFRFSLWVIDNSHTVEDMLVNLALVKCLKLWVEVHLTVNETIRWCLIFQLGLLFAIRKATKGKAICFNEIGACYITWWFKLTNKITDLDLQFSFR